MLCSCIRLFVGRSSAETLSTTWLLNLGINPGPGKQDVDTFLQRVPAVQRVGGLVTNHIVRKHQRQIGLFGKLHERGVNRLGRYVEIELSFGLLRRRH